MKKFRYAFPISAYVVYALLAAVSVFTVVFSSLRLAEVGNLVSVYPATDIASIVLFVVFLALMTLITFGTSYRFTEDSFVCDRVLFKKKIDRDRISKFVTDETAGVGALYYLDPSSPDTVLFVVICIAKIRRAAFVEALKSFKPDIVVEANLHKE